MAVKEEGPIVYKPRAGKVNGNLSKFNEKSMEIISVAAGKMIKNMGYYHIFSDMYEPKQEIPPWIKTWNAKALEKQIAIVNSNGQIRA